MISTHCGSDRLDAGERYDPEWPQGIPTHEALISWCGRIGLPEPMMDTIGSYRGTLRANEAASAFFRTFCSRLEMQADWPDPTADAEVMSVCGDDAWCFGLLAYLSTLPRAEAWYRSKGIDRDIFDVTMADIGLWGANNTERHGMVRFSEFSWIHLHLSCRLFRLGRLQFVLLPYHGDALFLRHRRDGRIAALAMPGVRIQTDGYLDGTDGWMDPVAWTTEMKVTRMCAGEIKARGMWLGHPIHPDGSTQREPVAFPGSDWTIALQPGDDTLDVHIPQGSPLDIEASLASFEQALPFFRRVFPQREPKAFHCHSWLLSPQFDHMLPETSNIVRFAHLFHRYPSPGDRQEAWERVFGHHAPTLEKAPCTSSLQHALHDWLSEGKLVFSAAGMHFPDRTQGGS